MRRKRVEPQGGRAEGLAGGVESPDVVDDRVALGVGRARTEPSSGEAVGAGADEAVSV